MFKIKTKYSIGEMVEVYQTHYGHTAPCKHCGETQSTSQKIKVTAPIVGIRIDKDHDITYDVNILGTTYVYWEKDILKGR